YAEEAIQHWIDSFHTGFVLDSLDWYVRGTGDQTPVNAIKTGFRYYIENFFLEDGTPKYYHDRIYPIDAHSPAQAFVTLTRLGGLDQRASNIRDHVRDWTLLHMRSPKGYFYFQKHPNYINKIPYMRWVQAWSYYGLAHLLFYDTFKEIHGYSRY
ncbi:MAG TPA: delta-aminolevulinic acid dehydratase, partial [bacterium]|nr:delta-aminolevulinic acid dehydratase [bacterium]